MLQAAPNQKGRAMANQAFQSSKLAMFAVIAATGAAMAQVTPEEVWQNWQDTSAAMGQTMVAGSVARKGDTLEITDVTIASAYDGWISEGSLDLIAMKDQGDGTVLITMSPEFDMKMRMPATGNGQSEFETVFVFKQPDAKVIASGSVDDMMHDLRIPTLGMKLERLPSPIGDSETFVLDTTLSNLSGFYRTKTVGDAVTLDSDFDVDSVALAVIGANPADEAELRLTSSMNALSVQSTGTDLGYMARAAQSPELLAAINTSTKIAIADQQFDLEIVDENGPMSIKGTLGALDLVSSIVDGTMDYTGSQGNLAMILNAPNIPLPDLAVALETLSFGVKMPLVPSDVALPFAFSTGLTHLVFSDQLWALFDPSNRLPRDPINLVIDTEGTAKPNAISTDMAAAPTLPAELETLNLKELRLSVAGAELAGAGTSTFEPVEGGLPNPNAKLDFTLTGANGLMDKLVEAGLIAPEMLTMPRMMLAMIARPAPDGSDSYQSAIEIKDKAIFANGQKLHQME
jgi:hypothetical protein